MYKLCFINTSPIYVLISFSNACLVLLLVFCVAAMREGRGMGGEIEGETGEEKTCQRGILVMFHDVSEYVCVFVNVGWF